MERKEMNCKFDLAWVGRCNKPSEGDICEKHLGELCWCGAQATRQCSIASSFVCGRPTCDEHGCNLVAGGLTGSHGFKHSEKGFAQWEAWKNEQPLS